MPRTVARRGGAAVPVNRRERTGFIEQMTAQFERHRVFRLAIAPEGTRSRTEFWKSGFYHLARAADVPLALGYIDYAAREVGVGGYVELTGDRAADMARLRAFYDGKRGRHPENQSPIRLRDDPRRDPAAARGAGRCAPVDAGDDLRARSARPTMTIPPAIAVAMPNPHDTPGHHAHHHAHEHAPAQSRRDAARAVGRARS